MENAESKRDVSIIVRVSAEERDRYKEEAWRRRVSLGELVRALLDGAVAEGGAR